MSVMAKKRGPTRMLGQRVDEQIACALDDYVESTDPPISKRMALEHALKIGLSHLGHWPRKRKSKPAPTEED